MEITYNHKLERETQDLNEPTNHSNDDPFITDHYTSAMEADTNVDQESAPTCTAAQSQRTSSHRTSPNTITHPIESPHEVSSFRDHQTSTRNRQYLSYLHEQLEKSFSQLCIDLPAGFGELGTHDEAIEHPKTDLSKKRAAVEHDDEDPGAEADNRVRKKGKL